MIVVKEELSQRKFLLNFRVFHYFVFISEQNKYHIYKSFLNLAFNTQT